MVSFPSLISATAVAATLMSFVLPIRAADPNFIVFQPDDLPFFEEWGPPAHLNGGTSGAVYTPGAEGLPNLSRLIKDGLVMSQAYAASSTCGTSRYSTITGRFPSRSSYGRDRQSEDPLRNVKIPSTKLEDVESVVDGLDCSENNIAALFNASGRYRTGIVGKWHLHARENIFDYGIAQQLIRDCGFHFAEAIYPDNMGSSWDSPENNDGREITHNMEHVVARAIEFMEDSIDVEKKPFFLYLNPTVPHSSGDVGAALAEADCRDSVEGYLPEEPRVPFGMTAGGSKSCREYRDDVLERGGRGASDVELGSIWIDDAIGSIYEFLRDRGELDNTFFLFQQDHGQEGKSTLYEQGARIFQLVHFPDAFAEGRVFEGLVSTVDIGPTILDYAGIQPSYGMDGQSWRAAVDDPVEELAWKERCLVLELENDRAVRCGCDKLLSIGGGTIGEGDSTTESRGLRYGFTFTQDGNNFFNLCYGDADMLSAATPEGNPEADGTVIPEADVVERLINELECHIGKTLPSKLVAPDYSECDGTSSPCVDLKTFLQKAGSQAGTERDCAWVFENNRCNRYADECPVSCNTCTYTPEPTQTPRLTPEPTQEPTRKPTDVTCVEGRGVCVSNQDCCSLSCGRRGGRCRLI